MIRFPEIERNSTLAVSARLGISIIGFPAYIGAGGADSKTLRPGPPQAEEALFELAMRRVRAALSRWVCPVWLSTVGSPEARRRFESSKHLPNLAHGAFIQMRNLVCGSAGFDHDHRYPPSRQLRSL